MTTDNKAPRDIVWVPEDFVFNSAEECLGVFPENGPACRFTTQSAYDKLQAELDEAREELKSVREIMHEGGNIIEQQRKQLADANARIEKCEGC